MDVTDECSDHIAGKFKTDPYCFLICADKFQTGYDEPLLHTIYVTSSFRGSRRCRRSRDSTNPRQFLHFSKYALFFRLF